jgi:hypothetical protein
MSSFPLCTSISPTALFSALHQPRRHLCRARAHPDPIHYHFLISPTSESCLHHLRPYAIVIQPNIAFPIVLLSQPPTRVPNRNIGITLPIKGMGHININVLSFDGSTWQ